MDNSTAPALPPSSSSSPLDHTKVVPGRGTLTASVSRLGHRVDELKSAMQKYVRRGMEDEALYCAMELFGFRFPGMPKRISDPYWRNVGKITSNCLNRLLVMVSEDVCLGDPLLPEIVDKLYDTARFAERDDKVLPAVIRWVRALCRAPKARMLSDLGAIYWKPAKAEWVRSQPTLYRTFYGELAGQHPTALTSSVERSRDDYDRYQRFWYKVLRIFKGDRHTPDFYGMPDESQRLLALIELKSDLAFYYCARDFVVGTKRLVKCLRGRKPVHLAFTLMRVYATDRLGGRWLRQIEALESIRKSRAGSAEAQLFVYHALAYLVWRDKLPIAASRPVPHTADALLDSDLMRVWKEHQRRTEPMELASYCIDKHTKRGRDAGKTVVDFAHEGAHVENECLRLINHAYRRIYKEQYNRLDGTVTLLNHPWTGEGPIAKWPNYRPRPRSAETDKGKEKVPDKEADEPPRKRGKREGAHKDEEEEDRRKDSEPLAEDVPRLVVFPQTGFIRFVQRTKKRYEINGQIQRLARPYQFVRYIEPRHELMLKGYAMWCDSKIDKHTMRNDMVNALLDRPYELRGSVVLVRPKHSNIQELIDAFENHKPGSSEPLREAIARYFRSKEKMGATAPIPSAPLKRNHPKQNDAAAAAWEVVLQATKENLGTLRQCSEERVDAHLEIMARVLERMPKSDPRHAVMLQTLLTQAAIQDDESSFVSSKDLPKESDAFEHAQRIQVLTSRSKPDTYYALDAKTHKPLFVKGPFLSYDKLSFALKLNNEHKPWFRGITPVPGMHVRWLVPEPNFLGGRPNPEAFGTRTKIGAGRAYPFLVCADVKQPRRNAPYPETTYGKEGKKWAADTPLADTSTSGGSQHVNLYSMQSIFHTPAEINLLAAVLFRYVWRVTDTCERNLLSDAGTDVVYSVDEESHGADEQDAHLFKKPLGRNQKSAMQTLLKRHWDTLAELLDAWATAPGMHGSWVGANIRRLRIGGLAGVLKLL